MLARRGDVVTPAIVRRRAGHERPHPPRHPCRHARPAVLGRGRARTGIGRRHRGHHPCRAGWRLAGRACRGRAGAPGPAARHRRDRGPVAAAAGSGDAGGRHRVPDPRRHGGLHRGRRGAMDRGHPPRCRMAARPRRHNRRPADGGPGTRPGAPRARGGGAAGAGQAARRPGPGGAGAGRGGKHGWQPRGPGGARRLRPAAKRDGHRDGVGCAVAHGACTGPCRCARRAGAGPAPSA